MALSVELKKDFGAFRLEAAFTAGNCVHGLLGASGCGKSMTLKCIAGVIRPDEGRIVLDGEVLFDSAAHINLPPQKRGLGLLFQNFALFPNMTVEQNIMAALHKTGDKKAARIKCGDMLRRLSLEEVKGLRPWQLSGGQQQRTALARILVTTPRLLMLDEPFSALDSYLRWQTELELTELLDGFDGTALLVTHSRDEVYRLCDTVTVLDRGMGRGEAPVRALFDAPATRSACLLSGCKNFSRAEWIGPHTLYAPDWGTRLECAAPLPDGLSYVGIRSHSLRVADGSGPNRMECGVIRVVEDVFSTVILMSSAGGDRGFSRLRLEMPKEDWAAVGGGERLWLELPPEALLPLVE